MRKFVIQSIAAAGMLLAVVVAVVAARVALAQKNLAAAFAVPSETEVVFIGNSHTGCTFTEAPEFRNRVFWRSGTGFMLHYLRFLELERRGAFDGNVKACVIDCDSPTLFNCLRKAAARDFRGMLPFTWRYWDRTFLSNGEIVREILSHPNKGFTFREAVGEEVPNWTTRGSEERLKVLEAMYGNARRFREANMASDDCPRTWRERLLNMLCDIKERCDRHGVRLILFASPLASDSHERSDMGIWTMVTELAGSVRELGVEYHDFRTACADDKFRDAAHLLPSSSYEFTKRFYADVLNIPVGN